jgi:hypothetical protein
MSQDPQAAMHSLLLFPDTIVEFSIKSIVSQQVDELLSFCFVLFLHWMKELIKEGM